VGAGLTLVTGGTGRNNTWSFVLDITEFRKTLRNGSVLYEVRWDAKEGNYTLAIDYDADSQSSMSSFVLVNRTHYTTDVVTPIGSSPKVSLVGQPMTTVTATLPGILTVVAMGILLGICVWKRKKTQNPYLFFLIKNPCNIQH
jgi:hypothetical protein